MREVAVVVVAGAGYHLIAHLDIEVIRVALTHTRQLRHLLQARVRRELCIHMLIKIKITPGTNGRCDGRNIGRVLGKSLKRAFICAVIQEKPG